MSLFSIFNAAKDVAIEVAVKLWFNKTYKRLGQMTKIQIDSENKNVGIELVLKGEIAPLKINVCGYEISSIADETFIQLGDIETSREWLNVILAEYLDPAKRRFKVPPALRVIL